MSKQITAKEVAEHNTVEKGLYIIIDNGVFSMADFVDEHPGGSKILKRVGGKDASKQFWKVRALAAINMIFSDMSQYHNEHVLKKYSPKLKIGELKEEAKL